MFIGLLEAPFKLVFFHTIVHRRESAVDFVDVSRTPAFHIQFQPGLQNKLLEARSGE